MSDPTVFELRNYLMQPNGRDVLIDLFERHFIAMQEDEGACVVGTFSNLDDPDRFVWIRSFPHYVRRATMLNAIYTSPTWQAHRTAANATMIDSDNVLLLRPHTGSLGCVGERAPVGATAIPSSVFAVSTYYLRPGGENEFAPFFETDIAPRLREEGGAVRATLITEQRENNYPRLPVREDVNVFVSITRFASLDAQSDSARSLGGIGDAIQRRTVQPTETFRLQPTPRSLLR